MRSSQDRSSAFKRGQAGGSERRGWRVGVALSAGAAALVSAGLVYWIGAGEDHSLTSKPSAASPPARPAYATARPDAGEVVRAYDQVQEIYADEGMAGVVRFSRNCADSLRADPGMLDFCLTFDIYAAALGGDEASAQDWRSGVEARDLALARGVLPPGQDPAARLAQVRALARQASLEAPSPAAPGGAESPTASAAPPGPATAAHPAAASSAGAARARHAYAPAACRQRASPGQRTVCASPALREADRRMRLAYRRALAAGASPRRLARDQARFHKAVNAAAPDRAAIARLYHRRTRALEKLARLHRVSSG